MEDNSEKKDRKLGDIKIDTNSMWRDIAPVSAVLSDLGEVIKAFKNLNDIKRDNYNSTLTQYREVFKQSIERLRTTKEALQYIFSERAKLEQKIEFAKTDANKYEEQVFQNILNVVVIPEENKYRKLLEIGVTEINSENNPVVDVKSENDSIPEIKTENIEEPIPEYSEIIPENSVYDPNQLEIIIPEIIDEPIYNKKTGNKLNNHDYIVGLRRFTWKDKRIPELLVKFFIKEKFIPEYSGIALQEFFETGKCRTKIPFDGNGNVLCTIFFELIKREFLQVGLQFLSERVERIFVKKGDSLSVLIAADSFATAMRPSAVDRRIKIYSKNYPGVVDYLNTELRVD